MLIDLNLPCSFHIFAADRLMMFAFTNQLGSSFILEFCQRIPAFLTRTHGVIDAKHHS
uniref:Uncharacterized protein n=1 Tax=Anguilla anguilla TaxID=7936 RepID=A0A0E9X0B7_ANGAN